MSSSVALHSTWKGKSVDWQFRILMSFMTFLKGLHFSKNDSKSIPGSGMDANKPVVNMTAQKAPLLSASDRSRSTCTVQHTYDYHTGIEFEMYAKDYPVRPIFPPYIYIYTIFSEWKHLRCQ